MTMIGNFQLFAEPYVMTQGGPLKATHTVVLLMYEEGFRWWRMGMAAAIAFVLFVIMLVGTHDPDAPAAGAPMKRRDVVPSVLLHADAGRRARS